MVNGVSNITIPSLSYSIANAGKMSIPVDTSALVYSQFEHVSGVPAPEGTPGVSISKLNLLDVLIGQVNRLNSPSIAPPAPNPAEGIDALIENLANQIRDAKAASQEMPYYPSPNTEGGVLFSLLS